MSAGQHRAGLGDGEARRAAIGGQNNNRASAVQAAKAATINGAVFLDLETSLWRIESWPWRRGRSSSEARASRNGREMPPARQLLNPGKGQPKPVHASKTMAITIVMLQAICRLAKDGPCNSCVATRSETTQYRGPSRSPGSPWFRNHRPRKIVRFPKIQQDREDERLARGIARYSRLAPTIGVL